MKNNLSSKFSKLGLAGWFVILLITIASFLRLYNLRGALQFQGDQGRDAIIVSQIFKERDFVFIGPVTSVGNMYLGPLYYYFMLPFLFLSYPSPIGPTYAVALLGIITVYLMYQLGQEMIGKKAALISTLFFTFSAIVIQYTRFSWNPNPAPLVSLLMVFFTYRAWQKHSKYWVLVALCFSILIQLHYLTLLAAAGAGLIWLLHLVQLLKKRAKARVKHFLLYSVMGVVVVALSLAPLILFDIKHQAINAQAFTDLLTGESNFKTRSQLSLLTKVGRTVLETEGRSMHILFEISIGKNRRLNQILVYSTVFLLGYLLVRPLSQKKKPKQQEGHHYYGKVVIVSYLVTGIIGTAFYEHSIFDHYIAYLFPITFLVYGMVLSFINQKMIGKVASFAFFSFFLIYNLPRIPLKTLGWSLDDIKRTSASISQRVAPGEKYNLVLLSESRDHYGQNYRYFLTTGETPPVKVGVTEDIETLFIINEEKKVDDVTQLPIYDIVAFPNKEVTEIYQIPNGPEITILKKTSSD